MFLLDFFVRNNSITESTYQIVDLKKSKQRQFN